MGNSPLVEMLDDFPSRRILDINNFFTLKLSAEADNIAKEWDEMKRELGEICAALYSLK